MATPALAFISLILGAALLYLLARLRRSAREAYIRGYVFPPGLMDRLMARRPGLTAKDCHLVGRALRHFFLAYLKGGRKFVSMPSQVVDDLWHEFILYTRHYETFSRKAFGRFLHHTPAAVLGPDRQGNAGLRRVWWHTCKEENINPRAPSRLPLLFALDAKLGIADGFHYAADCGDLRRRGLGSPSGTTGVHCGGDFSSSSYDGGTDGFGEGASGEGGGGVGSDGCGGGCGGGGD